MADAVVKVETPPEASHASSVIDKPPGANPTAPTQLSANTPQKDVVMSDVPIERTASPAPTNVAPSPAPGRTGTPAQGSRAPSLHPDSGFTMPSEAPAHGDSARRYLNTKVTGVLLEGMKQLAKNQ
ncbi:hypothetical protein UVI_02034680 [Ustilaginoidea virens]|nr:hypothetical protein UVI_02034680 [Ustilaginoidea virens]